MRPSPLSDEGSPANRKSRIGIYSTAAIFAAIAFTTALYGGPADASPGSGAGFTISYTTMPSDYHLSAALDVLSPAQDDMAFCNWLDGIPNRRVKYPDLKVTSSTQCTPVKPGKAFGLFAAPENNQLNFEVARVARRVAKGISVGPILVTFPDAAGSRAQLVASGGSIWVYDGYTAHGGEVLRISASTGVVLQIASEPTISQATIGANGDGFWVGSNPTSGLSRGVYVTDIGARRAQLVQATTNFIDQFFGSGSTMNAIESTVETGASPPYLDYRFVAK